MAARRELNHGKKPVAMDEQPRDLLLRNLPVESHRVDIAGADTAILEAGQGPPVILLHGGIQVGGVIWWRTIPELAKTNRLLIPDLPGLGESPPMAQPLDTAAVATWLEELVEKTTDQPPILVAHSLLGAFAMRYAMEHREQLRRLVLVSTPGLGRFRPKPGLVMALVASMIRPSPGTLNRFMGRVVHDLDSVSREEGGKWDALMDYLVEQANRPSVRQAMRQIPRGNLGTIHRGALRAIRTPTALIWGRNDPNTRLRTAEHAAEALDWPLHVIEEAGHIPHLERPVAFVEKLRSAAGEG